jgi:hypothetical protein
MKFASPCGLYIGQGSKPEEEDGRKDAMAGKVFIHATMSLDGFIADPDGAPQTVAREPEPMCPASTGLAQDCEARFCCRGAAIQ